MRGADNKFVAMENAPRGVFIGPLFLLGSHFMQTGKVLGIGAALSAGLLAAHVASASTTLTLEEFGAGGTGPATSYGTTTLISQGSGTYTAGGGSYGGTTWTGVAATISQGASGASLELAISGLTDSFSEWGFIVSDTSFAAAGSGASLKASGSYTVASAGSQDSVSSFGAVGYADPGNNLLGVPNGAGVPSNVHVTSSADSAASAFFGPAYATKSASATTSPVSVPGAYSITTEGIINAVGITGGAYDVNFTTTLSGTTSAVSLPGSGPLSLIGGLVVVGGLAIRRRMKL